MVLPEDLQNVFREEQAVYGHCEHQRAISILNTKLGNL